MVVEDVSVVAQSTQARRNMVARTTSTRLVLLFVSAFLIYALLPSRNFNYADDSLRWAYSLTRDGGLINSHHLYLNPLRWLYQYLLSLDIGLRPEVMLAAYSALWGAAGLTSLYWILARAGFGSLALWGTLLCGFSAGYWSYSIVGDAYVPSIAFMIAGIGFSYAAFTSTNADFPWGSALGAVCSFALMIFHHQAMFFFVIGISLAALLVGAGGLARRIWLAVCVGGGVALATVIAYAVAYGSAGESVKESGFIRFCAGYVDSFAARPDQKRIGLSTLLNWMAGESRALVSTNVIFGDEGVAQAIQARYPTRTIYPLTYLVQSLPGWAALGIGIASLAALALAVVFAARGIWCGIGERDLVTLVCISATPQIVFFLWWEGISDEFCLWTTPIMAILITRGAAEAKHSKTYLQGLVGLIFVSTLLGSITLYWDSKKDIDYVNDGFAASLSTNDFLLGFEDIQSDNRLKLAAHRQGFEYLNVRIFALDWSDAEDAKINAAISSAVERGLKVNVSPRLVHPPKSGLNFVRYIEESFDVRRAELLTTLTRRAGVEWLKLKIFLPEHFDSDAK